MKIYFSCFFKSPTLMNSSNEWHWSRLPAQKITAGHLKFGPSVYPGKVASRTLFLKTKDFA